MTGRLATVLLVAAVTLHAVYADVYMHNPRGSNDRNCERNVNRDNGNRLFDSQNNAAGGYACPRAVGGPETTTGRMYYYVGSKLPIEWTAQHGCGSNPKVLCELVIQYACEDTLDPSGMYRSGANVGAPRDGTPRDADDAATETIPNTMEAAVANTTATRRYGMHEGFLYYQACSQRMRNMGLFTADQIVRRRDARGTRQNPNGNRNGLECPEERDYYPYWHPTPWRDIAVLTSNPARCPFYTANTQNVRAYGECKPVFGTDTTTIQKVANLQAQGNWYNNKADCEKNGHKWVEFRFGDAKFASEPADPFECLAGSSSRINHLGNAEDTTASSAADKAAIPHRNNAGRYIWTVPNHVNDNCVLRLRYNISTADYPAWDTTGMPGYNRTNNNKPPITQDPYIQIGAAEDEFVSLALNTNQYGRTFQDRSYVFSIKADPRTADEKTAGVTIYNLNVRGKRGNIVQTYPSVEYDFVPNDLNIKVNDKIHFQWTGSDYNPRRGCNNAEGGPPDPNAASAANLNSRADRSNIIEMTLMDNNIPRDITSASALQGKTMFVDSAGKPDMTTIMKLAFLDQKAILAATGRRCLTREELQALPNGDQRENHPQNCAKINAAFTPYFDGGLVTMRQPGKFTYFSSRNNNFSNRDQTGRICIGSPCADSDVSSPRGVAPPTVPATINNAATSAATAPDAATNADGIIEQETFNFNEKDNDSLGDGDAHDCEEMAYNFNGISVGGAVALAFGMTAVGAIGTLIVQHFVARYRSKYQMPSRPEDRKPLKTVEMPNTDEPLRVPPPPPPRR